MPLTIPLHAIEELMECEEVDQIQGVLRSLSQVPTIRLRATMYTL